MHSSVSTITSDRGATGNLLYWCLSERCEQEAGLGVFVSLGFVESESFYRPRIRFLFGNAVHTTGEEAAGAV